MSQRWRGCLFEIVETLLLTFVIYWVVQSFVAQPYQIQQPSMEHTLEPGQMVLVDKLSPHVSDYKAGDIIIFNPPNGYLEDGKAIPFIKRVIGVAGDTVELKDGAVWVNGVQLNESYVFEGQPTTQTGAVSRWAVPDGYLFVLGDHREQSEDSRVFGPIPKSSVIGRAVLRLWPLTNFGALAGGSSPSASPSAP
jgi:signal peptidase I